EVPRMRSVVQPAGVPAGILVQGRIGDGATGRQALPGLVTLVGEAIGMTSYQQIGDGDWSRTTAAACHRGRVMAVDNGSLYLVGDQRYDDGGYRRLGDASWQTRFLASAGERLLSFEDGGSLYAIDREGGYEAVDGNWSNTSAAVGLGDAVYACCGGTLYKVDPTSGAYDTLSAESWSSVLLLGLGGRLYSVENSGSLYAIDAATGEYRQLDGGWSGTTVGAAAAGALWLLSSGTWYRVDPATGGYEEVAMDTAWDTRIAVAAPDERGVVCFERGGSLWRFTL